MSLPVLEKLSFAVPARRRFRRWRNTHTSSTMARAELPGYVEASRGCLHLCTHCPIPPVYGGRFFVLPQEVVLEDIRRQVAAGATHITFGDPDFLNGPKHSLRVVRAMHEEFPSLTFDFTAKVEHLLNRGEDLPEFAAAGCLFIITAVESLSDRGADDPRQAAHAGGRRRRVEYCPRRRNRAASDLGQLHALDHSR